MKLRIYILIISNFILLACAELDENPAAKNVVTRETDNVLGYWKIDSVTFTSNQFKDTVFVGVNKGFMKLFIDSTGVLAVNDTALHLLCDKQRFLWEINSNKMEFYVEDFITIADILDNNKISDLIFRLRINKCNNDQFHPFQFNNIKFVKIGGGTGKERNTNE